MSANNKVFKWDEQSLQACFHRDTNISPSDVQKLIKDHFDDIRVDDSTVEEFFKSRTFNDLPKHASWKQQHTEYFSSVMNLLLDVNSALTIGGDVRKSDRGKWQVEQLQACFHRSREPSIEDLQTLIRSHVPTLCIADQTFTHVLNLRKEKHHCRFWYPGESWDPGCSQYFGELMNEIITFKEPKEGWKVWESRKCLAEKFTQLTFKRSEMKGESRTLSSR